MSVSQASIMRGYVFAAFAVCGIVGTHILRDTSEFQATCAVLSQLPTVCRLEKPALADAVGAALPRMSAFANLSLEKGLSRFRPLLLAASRDGGPVGGLHLLRGALFELHGNMTDALCDFQVALAHGAVGSSSAVTRASPGASAEMQDALQAIDRLRIESAYRLAHDSNAGRFRQVFQEWRFEHDHHSTAIEGNTLSSSDVRALVETHLCPAGCNVDAVNEVLGVDVGYTFVASKTQYLNRSSPALWATGAASAPLVSLELLLRIHTHVLRGDLDAGVWRDHQVFVGDHRPPPADAVPALMAELAARWQSPEFQSLHPIVQAALAHFEFVWVHPFSDGNGRTARLLSSYLLMRAGYPPLNILVQDRNRYYAALHDSHPQNGGCSRALTRLFAERLLLMSTDLCDGLSRIPEAPTQASALPLHACTPVHGTMPKAPSVQVLDEL